MQKVHLRKSDHTAPGTFPLPASKHHMQILKQLHWNKDLQCMIFHKFLEHISFFYVALFTQNKANKRTFNFHQNLTKSLQTAVQSLQSQFQPSCFRVCKRSSMRYILVYIFYMFLFIFHLVFLSIIIFTNQ